MKSIPVHQTATTREDLERASRFRDAALPYLDSVYTLACYLLRDPSDAEDAVQECYLRALRHFDSWRNSEIKPWLFAILRNVCRVEYERRSRGLVYDLNMEPDQVDDAIPAWREAQESPETATLRKLEAETIRGLVAALPAAFREAIVLRELNELSYREIASIVGVPVGTVMSRLARGRAMLREAWLKAEHQDEHAEEREQQLKMPFEQARIGTAAETRALRM
jgi:RNA polymerase sigma-70 factor (ECF subfamily)